MRPETLAVTGTLKSEPITGSLMTPIFMTSTFQLEKVGQTKGFDYSRTGNPTRSELQNQLALLEHGTRCSVQVTGMAAATVVAHLFKKGDHVLCSQDCYGGVFRLLELVMKPIGIDVTFCDLRNLQEVRKNIKPNTRVIWSESPTNPMLRLVDIRALAGIAKESNCWLLVDNTFCSPYLQIPIDLGADIVIHSLTKYINGHCDTLGGAVITKDEQLGERIHWITNALGVGLPAFDSWLILRGLKTLPVRYDRQQVTSQKVAEFLEKHELVSKVVFPGLKSHPDHELAKKQQSGFGAMISFEVRGGKDAALAVVENTKSFALAESLGGVHSLIEVPAFQSHASMTQEARDRAGITNGLIRASIGLEHEDDLIEDLKQALEKARKFAAESAIV